MLTSSPDQTRAHLETVERQDPSQASLYECLMTTSPDNFDHVGSVPQSRQSESVECEARLRHVLSYICDKGHRRWTASAGVFLLIFSISGIPFSHLFSFASDVLALADIGPTDIFSPVMLGLVLLTTTFLPPLFITLFIFSRLRKIYRGF